MRLGVREPQRRPPRATEHEPALEAELLAQPLDVADQVRGRVDRQVDAVVGRIRRAVAAAALIEEHDAIRTRVEEPPPARRAARSRSPVQHDRGLRRAVAVHLPVDQLAIADVELPRRGRLIHRRSRPRPGRSPAGASRRSRVRGRTPRARGGGRPSCRRRVGRRSPVRSPRRGRRLPDAYAPTIWSSWAMNALETSSVSIESTTDPSTSRPPRRSSATPTAGAAAWPLKSITASIAPTLCRNDRAAPSRPPGGPRPRARARAPRSPRCGRPRPDADQGRAPARRPAHRCPAHLRRARTATHRAASGRA